MPAPALRQVVTLTPNKGVGADAYAPRPAPAGYRWVFVTENTAPVYENGPRVVELVAA